LNAADTAAAGARRARRWRRRGIFAASALFALAALLFTLDRIYPLPSVDSGGAAVVVAADGTPLRNYPSRDGIWRYPVKPDQVSARYLETLLTYEDRWFYWHPGVNPVALARAGWQWATNRRIVSGGSTLTMQAARLIDPELAGRPSRSLSAKLRQAWRAVQLEMHYSKDEILSLYLTHAPMGGIVEGVEMGSRLWLGKPARDLSPAEAAMLTALPQAPSRLRPDRHPEAAQAARDKVLDRMVELGRWTQAEVADAKIERVVAPPLRVGWPRWPRSGCCRKRARSVPAPGGPASGRPWSRPPWTRTCRLRWNACCWTAWTACRPRCRWPSWRWTTTRWRSRPMPAPRIFRTIPAMPTWTWCAGCVRPGPRSSPFCMRRRWTRA
jgi:penicillin-binding protein 1C